ncbi:hypothetical protein [Clostridium sp. FP1]|uniref:hypothetical protein n=1 Tax=Clostridium sp. FP1 TaxID=2724076 RepID=UPI0013E9608A|nr:hypothetical protein [Clostridium sp. FP1]MBZ9633379.1 hypothetical protein [Clostridium sp. FP1]
MPIKANREFICKRCGKKLVIECNDEITIEDLKKFINKLCFKCRIITEIMGH